MRCRLIVPQIVSFYTRFSLSNHKFKSLSNPAIFVCHIRLIVYETQIGAKSFDHTSDCFIILSDHKSKFFSNPSIFVYRTSNICLGALNHRRPCVCAPAARSHSNSCVSYVAKLLCTLFPSREGIIEINS